VFAQTVSGIWKNGTAGKQNGSLIIENDEIDFFLDKDIDNSAQLSDLFTEALGDFSLAKSLSDSIVLFDPVIEHESQTLRIIKEYRRKAFLIHIDCSVKNSLMRTYNENDIANNLTKRYKLISTEKKQAIFVLGE
jgi:hypothetical protein